ncbi:26S proteasome non-ATPase regulatory subunit 9 isoform X1 [Amborella trichopoda]|uniref:26S proteasome non-ATPase regulatory subunit 9 isoform X1 n=1 Tax=Amborella trichopoda TaxID=13333 RepID=UPI0005D30FF8|nr:26S proteasome non-ATPase regulatory subunit 9 isoform X1 [Amborella trichopoda]|eukprot:XP_011628049.1 26S proteasome non-ATPase regulatory subunit 9 isoform X1 [Amborella trichopoda]
MVGTNLKAETTALMEKRSLLEEQMSAIISRLCVPGGPGLSGNLLDSEGFPRADIDIAAVRLERNNLAVLRNDHKDITAKIDQNLQLLHSTRLAQDISLPPKVSAIGGESSTQVPNAIVMAESSPLHGQGTSQENFYTAMDEDPVVGVPFAIVDEIADGSPASDDGLQLGDQIVKFSNVEGGEQLLARLASEAQSNQGCALPLVIVRQGMFINLAVTPRPWHGRGLLGCHFRIL